MLGRCIHVIVQIKSREISVGGRTAIRHVAGKSDSTHAHYIRYGAEHFSFH